MQEPLLDGNTAGYITAGILGGLALFRKVWLQFSSDKVKSTRDSAEVDIIKALREEVNRVKEDLEKNKEDNREAIKRLEEAHKKERDDLEFDIQNLKTQIDEMFHSQRELRREVLDAYILTSNVTSLSDLEPLKDKLIQILDGDIEV